MTVSPTAKVGYGILVYEFVAFNSMSYLSRQARRHQKR